MKRSILLTSLLSVFCNVSILSASTNVPPVINGDAQWNQNGSPYLIQGKVIVPQGTTLQVGPGVQVIFQGAAAIEVNGVLKVAGSAAAPALFNMTEGGLQSEIFINNGEADVDNVKIVGGIFLVKDSKLQLEGADITKGSGLYLQGSTVARLRNNKMYGNATGITLDGKVKANLQFNTLVQNTYGLYIKDYLGFAFTNNSVHDNTYEVVNKAAPIKLGGNYWGPDESSNAVHARIQGSVDINSMKGLKDILRAYVRTQLPVITKKMSLALIAREKREAAEQAAELKKYKKQQQQAEIEAMESKTKGMVSTPTPATVRVPQASPSPAAVVAPPSIPGVPELPPSNAATTTAAPPAPSLPEPGVSAPASAISSPQPPALPSASEIPQLPIEATGTSTSATSVPVPPEVSGQPSLPPPSIDTMPPANASNGNTEMIPPPPDLNEQIPSTASVPPPLPAVSAPADNSAVPAVSTPVPVTSPSVVAPPLPPASSSAVSQVPAQPVSVPPAPAAPAASTEPNAAQQKAVDSLQGIGGDIDGMQAPDLGSDLSSPAPTSGSPAPTPSNPQSSSPKDVPAPKPAEDQSLSLPPLQDSDVKPPKDLDMPPIDDLGNVNLDSRNK